MAWIWAANPCCKCWNAGAFRVGAPGGMRLLVAGSLAGCCTCWLLVRLLVAGVEKDKHCQHCAAPHWPLPFRHSFDHAPGSWGVHGAGQPRRERNEIQKRKDEGRKLEAHTNHNVNDERPGPPTPEQGADRDFIYHSLSLCILARRIRPSGDGGSLSRFARTRRTRSRSHERNGGRTRAAPALRDSHRSRHSSGSR